MSFWNQIRIWVRFCVQKLKDFWWIWLTTGVFALVRSRVEDFVNTWLDDKAPQFLTSVVKNNMSFLPQSELGLVGWMFFLTILGIMILAYRDTRQTNSEVALAPVPLVPLSPQEKADVNKIAVLFKCRADPAYRNLQQLERKIYDRALRHALAQADRDEKGVYLLFLFAEHIESPCDLAVAAMQGVLDGADKEDMQVLQKRLIEIFLAYQNLVRWTHRVAKLFTPAIDIYSEYPAWQEKHKLFHQDLRVLIAADGFSEMRKATYEQWQDKFEE